MQIQITFRNLESSELIKKYAHEKINKIQKYIDTPIEVNITLSIEKHKYQVDVIIISNDGFKIYGQESNNNLCSAIDLVINKLDRQIKRYREKLKSVGRGNKIFNTNILFEEKNEEE